MTSRAYAKLDRNRLGSGLLLDDSDLQITTNIACDGERKVLGSLPVMSGEYAFETYVWSTSQGDLSGLVSIGVAQPASALDAGVGSDALSVGYWPADGLVKADGSTLSSPGKTPERICLGAHLSLSPSSATCDFLVNGSVVYTATLPTGKAWLPAIGIGSSSAADINAAVNFGGEWRFDAFDNTLRHGWSQQTAGLATIYLALASDAFMSSAGDAPANQPFSPLVLNAQQISVSSSVRHWPLRSSGDRANPASITTIQLDNSTGKFNALRAADVKGSRIVVQVALGASRGVGSLATAKTILTGIIEDVRGATVVSVTIRDVLTNYDRTARARRIPPFYDPGAAGQLMAYGIGSQRNVKPVYLGGNLYLLGDSIYTNIASVSDNAAPLDPNATPPQYTPALSHKGIALQTDAVGRVAVDCSTVGPQDDLPGAQDVLEGTGLFAVWDNAFVYSTTPPEDCEFSAAEAQGALRKMLVSPSNVLRIRSNVTWLPATSNYGEWLKIRTDEPLLAGRSYRLTFWVYAAYSTVTGGSIDSGGLMFRTALDNNPASAITAHGKPIVQATSSKGQQYIIDFRVPYGGSRGLYMIASAASANGGGTTSQGITYVDVRAVTVELLGQFITLPLQDATATAALTDILVEREGEDASVFSADDAAAITEPLRLRYETPPNVLDAICDMADVSGRVPFSDENGTIRFAKIRFPKDEDEVVADFSATNADVKNLVLQPLAAPGLTTQFGYRPNCTPFGDEFVTDPAIVTPALRAAYTAPTQGKFSTTVPVAQEYIANINAGRRTINVDDGAVARAIANEIVGEFGIKRQYCQFTAYFEWTDGPCLGLTKKIWPHQLYPGMVVTLHDPDNGLINQKMTVVDRQPYPFAGKYMIGGIF